MIQTVSFGQFFERVKKYLANNWPDISLDISDNEIALYTFEAIGEVIVLQAEQKYAAEGIYPDQEGFITKYSFACSTLSFDIISQVYSLTLPLPPINLPLGYSIKSPYFSGSNAKSFPLLAIHGYQKGYAFELPTPDYGCYYEVEGNIMNIYAPNVNLLTSGWAVKIPMLSPRSKTGSDDDLIMLPDDAMSLVFDLVTKKLVDRVNRPRTQANTGAPRFTEQP